MGLPIFRGIDTATTGTGRKMTGLLIQVGKTAKNAPPQELLSHGPLGPPDGNFRVNPYRQHNNTQGNTIADQGPGKLQLYHGVSPPWPPVSA